MVCFDGVLSSLALGAAGSEFVIPMARIEINEASGTMRYNVDEEIYIIGTEKQQAISPNAGPWIADGKSLNDLHASWLSDPGGCDYEPFPIDYRGDPDIACEPGNRSPTWEMLEGD